MITSWSKVPYFEEACRTVLGEYFHFHGFTEIKIKCDQIGVVYSNGKVFIGLDYWLEDIPKYYVLIGIGFLNNRQYSRDSGVGLWYFIPQQERIETCRWEWSDLLSLRIQLKSIRDDILPRHAEPLWKDTELLRQGLLRWAKENEAKHEAEIAIAIRKRAEAAFKVNNFKEAIKLYNELTEIDFRPSDQKRLEIAHKHMNPRANQ